MIKKIAMFSIWMTIAGAGLCMAQSSNSQTINNWGEMVHGVQLSISITTNIFQVGYSTAIESVIKNSSTNVIVVDTSAPTANFDVILTNGVGKLYHITTPMMIREPQHLVTIKPSAQNIESIPVTFGKTRFGDTVEIGDYTLKATRYFISSEGKFKLESNSIKVKIIK